MKGLVDMWIYIISMISLCIVLLFIAIKLYLIKKSIKEIRVSINKIIKADTNQLLTISSSDKEMKKLANDLNKELQDLRKEKLQYQNGNQELKRIITNISHDMRTPLTAISGYIDLMKENKEKQKEYMKIIEKKTEELTLLTDQLFDFSKTMDMGVEMQREKCCINEILEETLANMYHFFKEKQIEPKLEICTQKIYKDLDKHSIIRVFENILSNVCKYSDGDFKVTLNEKGIITFSNKATSLDATTVQKIFDRYFTVENAKKSTGLGLSISKQLVKLNEKKISAKYVNEYLIIQIEF